MRTQRPPQEPLQEWNWNGYKVKANTRSEARARLKKLLQEDQLLSFRAEKITRLPPSARVLQVA